MYVNIRNEQIKLETKQLDKMLDYSNEDVISRFTDMFSVNADEAQDIFNEMIKFMHVAQIKGVFIPDELLIIDEMWHNFILFTKDYQQFCEEYIGNYFHHLPASKKEKELQLKKNKENPDKSSAEFQEKLVHMMNVIYDHLGQETLEKWFRDYPEQYSPDKILSLRKK